MNTNSTKQVPFFHVELSGSAYEAGQMQGNILRSIPGWLAFLRSGKGSFSPADFQSVLASFTRWCPGVNEEIQGMADAAGLAPEEVIYYSSTYLRAPQAMPGHCSHFAVLPPRTANGHVLAARSYEFGDSADDLRLCTTRITGKYAYIGTSIQLFGRGEGINEHGLVVTTSAGGMPVGAMRPAIQDGFQFWALTRTILETCKTVDEALALIAEFPMASNPILIIADRSGQAAMVELHGALRAVKRIDASSAEQTICATNHYVLPEMECVQPVRFEHSITRRVAIESFLNEAQAPLDMASIQRFMATPYPAGPTCHFYEEYFGTMRSMVFDLTAGSLEICFGSPAANRWHTVDFSTPPSPAPYLTSLPMERADGTFWTMN